jgi:hypothetical protein
VWPFHLRFQVISHAGQAVITKRLPLVRRSHRATNTAPETATAAVKAAQALASVGSVRAAGVTVSCEPIRGIVPLWRSVLYRAAIAAALLVFVLMPFLGVLWLLGASVYYVCYGAELARRDKIERQYQSLKKRD